MSRTPFGLTTIAVVALIAASDAGAGTVAVFNTASVLAEGALSVTGEGLMRIDPYKFGGMGRIGYGVRTNMDAAVQVGYLDSQAGGRMYWGADCEFPLSGARGQPGLQVSAACGAHYSDDFGLDGTLVASWRQTKIEPYVGVDADAVFADKTAIPVHLVLGIEAGLRRNVAFIAELGVNLKESRNYVSAGVSIYP